MRFSLIQLCLLALACAALALNAPALLHGSADTETNVASGIITDARAGGPTRLRRSAQLPAVCPCISQTVLT